VSGSQGRWKPLKLFDAHGLHLYVSLSGHKSWRLKYRISGREKTLTLGTYPTLRLAHAQEMGYGPAKSCDPVAIHPTN
jgi:hypothetical protein